jgi:signal transduction histidine kinase
MEYLILHLICKINIMIEKVLNIFQLINMKKFDEIIYNHFGFETSEITRTIQTQLRIRYTLLIGNSVLYYLMSFSILGKLGLNLLMAIVCSALVTLIIYNLFRHVSIIISNNKSIIHKVTGIYLCLFIAMIFTLVFIPSLQYNSNSLFIKSNNFSLFSISRFWQTLVSQKSNYLLIVALCVLLILTYINITIVYGDSFFATKKIIREQQNINLSQQIKIFDSIQHELGNKIPALKNDLYDLKDYFNLPDRCLYLTESIRQPLPGEDQSEISTVQGLIDRMDRKINYAIATIDSLGSIIKSSPDSFNPEKTNVFEFLSKEIEKANISPNFVRISIEGNKNIRINIDTKQFSFLVQNFISNAVRHGGFENYNKKYYILIKYFQKGNDLIIDFINNGNPLSPDYTIDKFIEPYNYFGDTGNSGLGGYLIAMVVKNHNGKIEIVQNIDVDMEKVVCFRIRLNAK